MAASEIDTSGSMATELLMKSSNYRAAPILIVLCPTASWLSYLSIHVALHKGFYARRGFDVEVMQMAAGLVTPALLNRAIDYTTIPRMEN
jgi:ABC-type nitrate/sulfonate/bicarbonate transport system substrate-binding protein